MDERPPLCAIEDGDCSLFASLCREQIHYEIKARAIGEAEYRCQAKNHRVEAISVRLQKRFFRINLGLSVERNCLHSGILIHQEVSCAVYATTRRKYETVDAISPGDVSHPPVCGLIDLQPSLTIHFTGRVSYDGR